MTYPFDELDDYDDPADKYPPFCASCGRSDCPGADGPSNECEDRLGLVADLDEDTEELGEVDRTYDQKKAGPEIRKFKKKEGEQD